MSAAGPIGVVVVGHGATASQLLEAATGIVDDGALGDVVAVDAGDGETPDLSRELCDTIERVDTGRGVLMLVDLLGSSPCTCGLRESAGHDLVVLAGLNLAMLLKLASLDRLGMTATELAEACGDSGRRAVAIDRRTEDETG